MTARLYAIAGASLVLAALVIALFATRATLAEVKADRDITTAKLLVSNASVGRLTAELERINAEQHALATSDAQRLAQSRQTLALVDAADKVRDAARERLLASAGAINPKATCEPSETVLELWP